MKYLIPLLLCLRCFAQLPVIPATGGRVPPPIDSLLPGGISHDWDASTTATGNVALWTDKVSGWNWYQSTGTNQPISDGFGVSFYGTNVLQNTNMSIKLNGVSGTDAAVCVLRVYPPGTVPLMIIHGTCSGGDIFLGFYASGGGTWYSAAGGNPVGGQANTNTVCDFLWAGYNSGSDHTYTNGVLWSSQSLGDFATGGAGLDNIGKNFADACTGLRGTIYRFIQWTNVIGFTTTQVSNIHYWAQSKYGATP